MNLFAIAGLSVAISCSILSLIALLFGKTRLHRLLLNFNIILSVWGLGVFLVGIADSGAQAMNAWKVAYCGGFFIAPGFFHIVRVFCEERPGKLLYFIYLQGLFFSLASIGTDLVIHKPRYVFDLYYNMATPLYAAGILCYLIIVLLSYFELFRFLKKTQGHKRLQTKYIIFGFMFGFIGGTSTVFPAFQINIFYPFGNFGITLYAFILTYAILRHRVMDIQLIFRRTMVYTLSAILLVSLFLVLILIMNNNIPDVTGHAPLNLFAISGLSVVISCAILSLIILCFGKTRLHRLLLNFNIFIAVWGLGLFLAGIANSEAEAVTAWKIACFGGFLIAPCFFHMVRDFCEKSPGIILYFIYLQGLFFSLASIGTDNMINEVSYVFGLYYNMATPLYAAGIFCYVIVVLFSYFELFRLLKNTLGDKRLEIKCLIFGCMFGFVGATISMFPMFGINIFYPFGNFGITLYAFILTYAILRHRVMDIHLMYRRTMVYSLSAGLLTALFLLLILIMSNYISGVAGQTSLWASCTAALIIAVLFAPLKKRIQLLIDKVFYKTRYDYYRIIQKTGSDLVTLIKERDIQDYILELIFKTLKVKSAYFLSMNGGDFIMTRSRVLNDNGSTEDIKNKLDSDSELVRRLNASKTIIIRDELSEGGDDDRLSLLAEELNAFKGKIAIPFFIEGRLSFILILGDKLSDDMYSDEDTTLLRTISSQAAVSLKNAMLYRELEQRVEDRTAELSRANAQLKNEIAERKRSEAELKRFAYRLEQSNRELEDFTKIVSHDLQEPLWKVKMFGDRLKSGYAETLEGTGREYMEAMYSSITRMQLLINDLLALSRVTVSAQPNIPVDLNRVINEVLVDLDVRTEQVKGRVDADDLPVIDGDHSQMRQLFQNLISNALKFHSTDRPPVVKISSRITDPGPLNPDRGDSAKIFCTILIEDNGIGFDINYLDYIFGVFQRLHGPDKYKGTGMGLAICRKIVERHGGNITAKSTEEQGSTFIVTLPVSQSSIERGEASQIVSPAAPSAPSG